MSEVYPIFVDGSEYIEIPKDIYTSSNDFTTILKDQVVYWCKITPNRIEFLVLIRNDENCVMLEVYPMFAGGSEYIEEPKGHLYIVQCPYNHPQRPGCVLTTRCRVQSHGVKSLQIV